MVGDWRTSRYLVKELPRKGLNLMGLCKDQALGGKMHRGGQWQEHLVLDHIILDLTGGSLPLEHIEDASVQRQFQRKKRLLRKSNTVLVSRLAIMALVAIMLVVTTLLTWYFTSTYSARSVKSLASVLREQLLRNSNQAMVGVLGELYNATVVLSSLHQRVYFASLNHTWESVEPELRTVNDGVFRAQAQYSSVAFVGVDGRVTDYSRTSRNAQYLLFVNATRDQPQVWYIQNVTGLVNETNAPRPIVRKPPYPLSAANLLNVSPTQMYWSIAPNSFGNPVVSPAVPVKDLQTNALLGLSTITTTFTNLNRYLSTIDLLGGYLYFEWHNGTNSSAVVAVSYNATHDLLKSPADSNNAVVKAAATFLAATYGYNETASNRTHSSDVKIVGQKYYIDTMPLTTPPFGALNLTAVMIVPRKSIMGKIDQRNRTVIGVSVGTAIGVLLLGCCFICFVTGRMSTEMHLRQELIRQLVGKHRAEQSSNYKSQFLANMSHEMRTPMAGIIGLLDLLSCDSLTPEQEFSVAQIRRCATGLLALVNNVLDISKAEAGKLELDITRFSVADELESLVDMFAAQSVKSSIDVALDLSDNIPAVVRGDANRIRQVFSNLLSNSVKFTAHGHVLVRGWVDQSLLEPERKSTDYTLAAVARREKGSGPIPAESENKLALVFEVDDSGCGIPVDLREAVFDSFVQGDDSMTRIHGGSGLGLYIVRSLVELMGGQVAVLPKQGSGTLVRFHVIVEKASHPDIKKAVPDELHPIGSPSPDGLNSLLGSPATLPVTEQMPPPEVLARTHVVVAMEEGVSREIAAQWLERNGLIVTCVDVWEDIVPTLEDMCKSTLTDSYSDKEPVIDETVEGSHSSPAHFERLDSKSQVSESNRFPSVLALVDISMHPSSKLSFERQVLEPSFFEARENSLTRSDPEKLPGHVQNILDSMTRIHSQHSLAVGWIVAPDCGPKWKHSLQADNSFLVMNKPLLGTRMRRLLCLLSRTGKLEQHHWDDHSYQSSPSTAGLRTMHSEGESVVSRPIVIPLPDDESFINRPTDFRDPSVQSAWTSGDRSTHSARTSSDEVPKYDKSESGEENYIEIAPEVLAIAKHQPIRISLSRESSLVSLNYKSEPMSEVKDAPERLERQVLTETQDKARKLGVESSESLQKAPSIESGCIPEVLSSNLSVPPITPEEPTSGPGNPEGANSHPHIGSDLQRNAVEIKEVGDEWSHVKLSLSDDQSQRRRSLSEWPAARNESGNARDSRRKSLSGWPADTKDELVSSAESTPEMPISTARASNAAAASAFATKALASIHILLVEDTPVLQRLACMMLKKLGAIVTVVGDGLQAVMAVSEALEAPQTTSAAVDLSNIRHFDLILMDCAMPVMDGYNATLAIRAAEEKTSRHIPIVALTAHALASDEERCLSVGMDAYLTKPINCKLLVTTIQELVVKDRV